MKTAPLALSSFSQPPTMRKLLTKDSGAKADKNKAGRTLTTNKIWQTLLLFLTITFFNLIYISKNILVYHDENQNFYLELYSSFMVKNNTSIASLDAVTVVEDNPPKDEKAGAIETTERHSEQNGAKNSTAKNNPIKTKPDQKKSSEKNKVANQNDTTTKDAVEFIPRHKQKTLKKREADREAAKAEH